jgi:tRNA modification GTPase
VHTIAAIVTAVGEGGVALIRVSGDDAIGIVSRVFRTKNPITRAASHTVHYGHIVDERRVVEEVLVTIMRAPRSYTCEDVVEIGVHGGRIAARRVLSLLVRHGVCLAEPGEFTKRAFLNGRIDLAQAEAIADIIRAKSDRAHTIAMRQLQGAVSQIVRAVRARLLDTLAQIEVHIDYPEHEEVHVQYTRVAQCCTEATAHIDALLQTVHEGKVVREGVKTAIVGKPNVGKSSLLNALMRCERAIVTDVPGTTRDVLREYIVIEDVPLIVCDTAGLRQTDDIVEQAGIARTWETIADAQLIVVVLDASRGWEEGEREWIAQWSNKPMVVVLNKSDLPAVRTIDHVRTVHPHVVCTCTKHAMGIDALGKTICAVLDVHPIDEDDATVITHVRHEQLLVQARTALCEAHQALRERMPIDVVAFDVHAAWQTLGQLLGEEIGDSLLDHIFSQFCLGK